MTHAPLIAISAGEPSGDEHGAELAHSLKAIFPECDLVGMGGPHLREAGMTATVNFDRSTGGSLMGFGGVFRSLGAIKRDLSNMSALLRRDRPDLLITIDYPDFNLRLAKVAKAAGIPALCFIPPKVWAWRSGRVRQMNEIFEHTALIYPHEKDFFTKHGYERTSYVGHPFAFTLGGERRKQLRKKYRSKLGLSEDELAIALLPGSRSGEIARTLKPLIEGYRLLKIRNKKITGILPVAPSLRMDTFRSHIRTDDTIKILSGESLGALAAADAGLLKSGTSNLQAAFLDLPFAMFYKASKGAELIVRTLVNVKEFSPVNVVRSGSVRELLQNEAAPSRMAEELERLLFDQSYRSTIQTNLKEVVQRLSGFDPNPLFEGATSAYERVARIAQSIIEAHRRRR